jgi:hypothetical protein
MAEKGGEESKSLEMRIAAIEDKLSKMHITEEEMKAYEKVSALMGGGGHPMMGAGTSPQVCTIARNRIVYCWRSPGPTIIPSCECTCGPCAQGGAGGFGGGFGGFGM